MDMFKDQLVKILPWCFVGISEPLTTCELADYPGVYNQRYDFMMQGNIGVQGNIFA